MRESMGHRGIEASVTPALESMGTRLVTESMGTG